MIEGYYVAAFEDFIDLVIVHGFPKASARLIFVPVLSVLMLFNDVLYFPNLLGDLSPRFP